MTTDEKPAQQSPANCDVRKGDKSDASEQWEIVNHSPAKQNDNKEQKNYRNYERTSTKLDIDVGLWKWKWKLFSFNKTTSTEENGPATGR